MSFKDFPYKDIDGNHWPDTYVGNEEYYVIDYSDWVSEENDSVISVSWNVQASLIGTDAHEVNNKAYIKLKAEKRGSFKVVCTLTSEEDGKQQKKVIEMILKVF